MMKTENRSLQRFPIVLITVAIAGVLLLTGCSSDEPTGTQDQQVSEIRISPEETSLEVGEEIDFSVVALTASGEVIDTDELDIEWQWWSTDSDVFTVEAGGQATGQGPGEAFCVVEAIINVAHNVNDMPDKLIIQTGYSTDDQTRVHTTNLTLSSPNPEPLPLEIENVSFNTRMRFVGRDSANVTVLF